MKINECGDETSMPAYPVVNDVSELPVIAPEDISVGVPVESITVYANSINPVAYNPTDTVNAFDIVFAIQINDETGSKTYQVVKRIGVDKVKLANQAQLSTPITIVESAQKNQPNKRWLALAGLE